MDELDREFFEDYKKFFPGMDLETIHSFARLMMRFHQIKILMEGYFNKMGLTKSRFMVLIQLYRKRDQGMSIGDISHFHQVRSATMTGIIDTLEREGQIERIHDPSDRRRVIVRITGAGRELMEKFLPRYQRHIKQMLNGLSEKERRTFSNLLEKLHRGVLSAVNGNPDEAEENV
jgi:DNA-binding MarR family transcriptional regulator